MTLTATFGFPAGITGDFHKMAGVAVDFGGRRRDHAPVYEYPFGPQFSLWQSIFSVKKEKLTRARTGVHFSVVSTAIWRDTWKQKTE
jgi:hypothetical protein